MGLWKTKEQKAAEQAEEERIDREGNARLAEYNERARAGITKTEWERTCSRCRTVWYAPIGAPSGALVGWMIGGVIAAGVAAAAGERRRVEAGRCPKCGSSAFTQQEVAIETP